MEEWLITSTVSSVAAFQRVGLTTASIIMEPLPPLITDKPYQNLSLSPSGLRGELT